MPESGCVLNGTGTLPLGVPPVGAVFGAVFGAVPGVPGGWKKGMTPGLVGPGGTVELGGEDPVGRGLDAVPIGAVPGGSEADGREPVPGAVGSEPVYPVEVVSVGTESEADGDEAVFGLVLSVEKVPLRGLPELLKSPEVELRGAVPGSDPVGGAVPGAVPLVSEIPLEGAVGAVYIPVVGNVGIVPGRLLSVLIVPDLGPCELLKPPFVELRGAVPGAVPEGDEAVSGNPLLGLIVPLRGP
jgi:hypothetical protein